MDHFMAENQLQFLHGICALWQNNAGAAGKQANGHGRLHRSRAHQPVVLFSLSRMVPLPSQQVQNVRLRHWFGLGKHHMAESQMCANPPQHNRRKTRKPDDSQSHKPPPRQLQNHARYSDTIRPIETKMQIIGQHPQDGANRWPQAAAQQGQKRHQARRIQTQLEQNRKADGKQIFRHAPQPKHAPEQQRPNSHHCRQQAHWEKRCIAQLFRLYFRVAFPLTM